MITYPLQIPATLGEAKANLKKFDAVGEVISPFSGASQQQQWQDQHWELDLAWPEMTWPQFAAYDAFIGALHGKFGSFLWGPPLATKPQGLGPLAGSPVAASPTLTIQSIVRSSNLVTAQCHLPTLNSLLAYFVAGRSVAVNWTDTTFNGVFPLLSAALTFFGGVPVSFQLTWTQFGPDTGTETSPNSGTAAAQINLPGSNLLFSSAWFPSTNAALLTGDFMQATALDVNGVSQQRLYQYVAAGAANSDGGGNIALDIFPSLREQLPDGTPLVLLNPQGTFRLADNRREAPAQSDKTLSLQLKCREAI